MKTNRSGVLPETCYILVIALCSIAFFNLYGQDSLTIDELLRQAAEKQQTNDIRGATHNLNIVADRYWEAADYENAVKYYMQSIELNTLIQNWNGIAGINGNLGVIYFDMGDYDNSIKHLRLAYNYRKENNEHFAIVNSLINMSVTLNKMRRFDESIVALEEAVNVSRLQNDFQQLQSIYGMLSEAYTFAGNLEKAGEYFHLYKAVHDALLSDTEQRLTEATFKFQLAETERELAEARQRYADYELLLMAREFEGLDSAHRELLTNKTRAELLIEILQANEEIAELERVSIEKQLVTEQQKTRSLIFALVVTLLAIIAIGYFFWQKKQDNEKLEQQNVLIKSQKAELEEYQEKLEDLVVVRTSNLMKALDKAQESDRLKSAFFSNMSHEIRTPLNAILGFSQMIGASSITPEERTVMFEHIKFNAAQLTKTVEDVVLLSEIDSGIIVVNLHEYDARELLNNAIAEANHVIKSENKQKIEIILNDNLPQNFGKVIVDAGKLNRVLAHLIGNAIKHTNAGYIILECSADQNLKQLNFKVEDSGEGIDEKNLEKIFERFWKKGDAFTQNTRGLGIGLSLCKEFLKLMGSQLSVTSQPGSGSTFSFSINYESQ